MDPNKSEQPNSTPEPSAVILGHCPDRKGINSAITHFISEHNGNIIDYVQHVDSEQGVFFVRIEWELKGFALPREEIEAAFKPIANRFAMTWNLHFSEAVPRMAIFVSRQTHCLYDLLARQQSGEWRVDIPLVIGNHPEVETVVRPFGIDYRHIPMTPETRVQAEQEQLALLEQNRIDFVVLARYMQVVSPEFIAHFPNRIINIHHSFLPAFVGAKPYHAAHARGVKIVGATSHYVTNELDQGPIIDQDVIRVSHKDAVEDLVRKGKDLEKIVLARAIWSHLNRQILVYNNKTVIFE
ncbi:MAG TPA: formyltetrahydrofolate deformylase [Verrucomicrobia bacterium]|nr:MAG: formyltetrahydrofolate deformylase [Lentisphaerae bacterium GWF2_57_35]HBA83665.1 formyltetrahydrofolate deformylase [Verrucomicrobiota bacterium]